MICGILHLGGNKEILMRFEIEVRDSKNSSDQTLHVNLYTKKDEYYEEGGEEGIYGAVATVSPDRKQMAGTIAQCVNACLDDYEKEIEKILSDIVKKNQQSIENFMEMCFPNGLP